MLKQVKFTVEWPGGGDYAKTVRFSEYGVRAEIKAPELRATRRDRHLRPEDIVLMDPVQRVVQGKRRDEGCAFTIESKRWPGEPPRLTRLISTDHENCLGIFEEGEISEDAAKALGKGPVGSSTQIFMVPSPD